MDNNLRVIEYIRQGGEILTTADGSKITASQMLERFLFPPEMQWSIIGKLSGGEKKRLYLLRVLMESPNILLLDEPTNDLDIETLTILEDYLESFQGAVISVSHDRYFLDRTCEKIFAFEGNGKIKKYNGNYSDYKEKIENENEIISNKSFSNREENSNKKSEELSDNISSNKKEKPLKFTFKEQKEYEEIDQAVASLENEIEKLQIKIDGTITDYTLLEQLLSEKEEIEKQLEVKMERWIYLNELAEKIKQIKS
jgi:ABC transport system ATP-binding/permease protein